MPAALIGHLSFCSSRVISHFFCDIAPWIVLACGGMWAVELASFGVAFCVILGSCVITPGVITPGVITPGVITLVSYAHMVVAIVRTPSAQARHPAFSTSHLTVGLTWYGSVIFLHVGTSAESSLDLTKAVSVLNTIIAPLPKPFIYTLRTEDVKEAVRGGVRGT